MSDKLQLVDVLRETPVSTHSDKLKLIGHSIGNWQWEIGNI